MRCMPATMTRSRMGPFSPRSSISTVRTVKAEGSRPTFTSSHASGVATQAPGRARGQNDDTAVASRLSSSGGARSPRSTADHAWTCRLPAPRGAPGEAPPCWHSPFLSNTPARLAGGRPTKCRPAGDDGDCQSGSRGRSRRICRRGNRRPPNEKVLHWGTNSSLCLRPSVQHWGSGHSPLIH